MGRPKLAEVAHVTQHHFQGQKVKRQGHQAAAHRRVVALGGCSGGRANVLAVGDCCYVVVCSAAQGVSAPTGRGEGRGHTVATARLQFVFVQKIFFIIAFVQFAQDILIFFIQFSLTRNTITRLVPIQLHFKKSHRFCFYFA